MIRQSLFFLFLVIFFTGTSVVYGAPRQNLQAQLKALEKTPLPKIHTPKIEKKTLKNGMRLLMLSNQETPVVRGYLLIRTGAMYEPADKLGLAQIMATLLRTGGTKSLKSSEINERLANLGAKIQSSIKRESAAVSFQCLAEDLDEVLAILFEMLREPAFEEEKFKLAKLQLLEEIRRQNDRPAKIASREFNKIIYGSDSIWSRTPSLKSVRSITRQDVQAFYQRFIGPNRIIFSVSGDIKKSNFIQKIEKLSQNWPKQNTPLPKTPVVEKVWEAGVYLAKKGTDQATILMGHFGDKRFNPDKFALLLLNDIVGGDTMSSRLGKKIRSSLGLAYGIYSHFGLQSDYGVFYVFAQTKAASAAQVLREIHEILSEIAGGKSLTADELAEHKRSVVNSLFAEYEPVFNFVRAEARFEYFGYPPNYLAYFREHIQRVSLKDLRRVAKKYLRPDHLKVLIVGDTEKMGKLPAYQNLPLDIL